MSAKGKKRWYQFTLRTLLLLMLLCAVGLMGWLRYIEPFRREQAVIAMVERLGGRVKTESVYMGRAATLFPDGFFVHLIDIDLSTVGSTDAGGRTKLVVTDADLQLIRDLPRLRSLNLNGAPVTDEGVAWLSDLPELRSLVLGSTQLTGTGLRSLARFSKLEMLYLPDTRVTHNGLVVIGQIRNLRILFLGRTGITDSGMPYIARMKNLQELWLDKTEVSDAGLKHLSGLTGLTNLYLQNTNASEVCLPMLSSLPNLARIDADGSQIIPAALRRAMPKQANRRVDQELDQPTTIEMIDTPCLDLVEYVSDYHRMTIVMSHRTAGLLVDVYEPVTASIQGRPLREALQELLEPRGIRTVPRYGCLQLITGEDSPMEEIRMVLGPGQTVSQSLSALLYGPSPYLDSMRPGNPQRNPYSNEMFRTRLRDALKGLQGLKIPVALDEPAFADRQDLLERDSLVPAIWTCNLSSALESIFDLFDVHGVIENDTIVIRPGPALYADKIAAP